MVSDPVTESEAPKAMENMELEEPQADAPSAPAAAENAANGVSKPKREREAEAAVDGGAAKKQKAEKSVEEERLEKVEDGENGGDGDISEEKSGPVTVGAKTFESSMEMFDYFYKLLHHWSPNLNVNRYEHTVLLDLIKKGHSDLKTKIGDGVKAFQIRNHPVYKNRCFFVIRSDGSADDFSFRKCVDNILPLPENMKAKREVDKVLGGGRGGRGRGRGGVTVS